MTPMDFDAAYEDATNGTGAMDEVIDALRDARASEGAVDLLHAIACDLIELRHKTDDVLTRMERDLRSAGA
jgi:hypothetical protein